MIADPEQAAVVQCLQQLWRDALQAELTVPEGDFFAAGGDSVRAMQLLSTVTDIFGWSEYDEFFTQPTLEALTRTILKYNERAH